MYALTVDRRRSRDAGDSPSMSDHRERFTLELPRPVLDWQISAGDELQALYESPRDALEAVLVLADELSWHVGVGIGTVDTPLPTNVNEATGSAFVAAREAVGASKDTGYPAVRGSEWASHAESVLTLACAVRQRRTDTAKEATELAGRGFTQQRIAQELDIAQSSVSRRLSSALWSQEQSVHPAVISLFELADSAGETP